VARAATVLVVDDEAYVRDSLIAVLRRRGHDARGAPSAEQALRALGETSFDAVVTDLRMPGFSGLELLQKITALVPGLPVVVLTGHGTVSSAVECMKAGAADYLLKPADPDQLALILERVAGEGSLRRELDYLRGEQKELADEVVGASDAWRRVLDLVDAAAPAVSTVLLVGESGTGKELLAQRIHRRSPRAAGPFVRVNCAAIPLELFESEFFGYRKGAFTGAAGDRDGRFRVADGGTLFMDEVASMAETAQAKILRVLQDGEFERVGDTRPTRVDVRLVAATNVVLEDAVRAGRFRNDLYYRLNVVQVRVPPLCERREDVPLLAAHFVEALAPRVGRRLEGIEPEALRLLSAYDWPGNVRELRNVIERALILERGRTLTPASLALTGAAGGPPPAAHGLAGAAASPAAGLPVDLNLRATLGSREREILVEALRRAGGVRKDAAALLGIDQRNLSYYLRKHGLDPDHLSR
jgi:DNA-binding NtrC family response regulator